MEQSSEGTEDSGGIEQVFAHPKIARDLQELHLAACRVAYSSAITTGALRALLDTGAEVVFLAPPGGGKASIVSCPQDVVIAIDFKEAETRILSGLFDSAPPTHILEAGMSMLYNFHAQEYPGCTPSWLMTEPTQNKHFFKPSSKTGVKAAKRAAAKRRRSKS